MNLGSDDGGFSLWPSTSMNPGSSSGLKPVWGEDQPGRSSGIIWPLEGSRGGSFWTSESGSVAKGGGQRPVGDWGRTPSGQEPKSLTVPYISRFQDGLQQGMLMIIIGTPEQESNGFCINLETTKDIAFHFNPRFNENGRQVMVRNSCINKKWGSEEREQKNFPFVRGQTFKMMIKCASSWFEVFVKDSPLFAFKYRTTDLKSITKLTISRGLQLSKVNVQMA